jgi:hypothetical protein
MPRVSWICNSCNAEYEYGEAAQDCEETHKKRIANSTIDWNPTISKLNGGNYPQKIRIKFSDSFEDFATYTLEHIGHEGI